MKVRTIVTLVACLFLVTVGVQVVQAGPDAKPIELKVASFLPEGHNINVDARQIFGDIEQRTGGKVQFRFYDAGTLLSPRKCFQGTVDGITDICTIIIPAYTPGRFPLTSLLDLAPNIAIAADASVACWKFFNKRLKNEWKDVKVLAVYIQTPHHIHMGKAPVRSLSDLEGKQLRVYAPGKKVVQAWGGIPVTIPMSDAYVALEKGVCDGIMAGFTEMKAVRLADVTKYHTIIGCLASPFVVAMNWKTYNSLPDDVKKIFDDMGESASKTWGAGWDRSRVENIEYMKKQGGHEFILLPPDELAKWRQKASSINEAWIAELEAKGVPARDAFKERQEIWKQYLGEEVPWAEDVKQ